MIREDVVSYSGLPFCQEGLIDRLQDKCNPKQFIAIQKDWLMLLICYASIIDVPQDFFTETSGDKEANL